MKDTIYREDAIKALERRYEDILRIFKRKVKVGEKALALDLIECVKALPSADRPQGWIPCSERLPEYRVPVLTWDGSIWTVEQRIPFVLDDDLNRIYSEWWVDADFDEVYEDAGYYPNLRDGAAVAWMPLPEPWKGADDESACSL